MAEGKNENVSKNILTEEETAFEVASQWKLIWWKFRRHKLAIIGSVITIMLYLIVIFAEFFAPFPKGAYDSKYTYAPPQGLNFISNDDNMSSLRPYVYGYTVEIDQEALRRTFVIDKSKKYPIGFFVEGESYKLLGIIPMNIHLIGPIDKDAPFYLFGADKLGRDIFSRVIYGTRVSMTIGLVGVFFSLLLGVSLGGVSGYYGGKADIIIQRLIELLRSIPTIPLWMGLAAAVPSHWHPLKIYFSITLIISLIAWTGLGRVIRGKFMSLKSEDFVTAARLDGASEKRIIFHHMLPSFTSHIIASTTLAIPRMIIAETSLSFLGIGLRPPVVSWGVLLQAAQRSKVIASAPWLLFIPGIAVVIAVLSLNFLGDGLRDAADPYSN